MYYSVRHGRRRTRRGGIALILLLSLPALLLIVGLALHAAQLVEVRTEMHAGADAAALAAAQTLVDDSVLLRDPARMRALFARAREAARVYAHMNPVYGEPLALYPNEGNAPDGDIVFGALDNPRGDVFVAFDLGVSEDPYLHAVNAVRVTARRTRERGSAVALTGGPLLSRLCTDVVVPATAMLDRDVIGFRPRGDRPIPLAPIALLSDPRGRDENCWEHQVERRGGSDCWAFQRGPKRFVRQVAGDGLFEMQVRLGPGNNSGGGKKSGPEQRKRRPNACLLQIGTEGVAGLAAQLVNGVRRGHLKNFGDEFVLGKDNRLVVPGTPFGPATRSRAFARLLGALEEVRRRGEPLVWPLYSRVDPHSHMPVLTGFVAARVVWVGSPAEGEGLSFLLQPAVISSPAAVTDSTRRGVGGVSVVNPYVCKVRLVE